MEPRAIDDTKLANTLTAAAEARGLKPSKGRDALVALAVQVVAAITGFLKDHVSGNYIDGEGRLCYGYMSVQWRLPLIGGLAGNIAKITSLTGCVHMMRLIALDAEVPKEQRGAIKQAYDLICTAARTETGCLPFNVKNFPEGYGIPAIRPSDLAESYWTAHRCITQGLPWPENLDKARKPNSGESVSDYMKRHGIKDFYVTLVVGGAGKTGHGMSEADFDEYI